MIEIWLANFEFYFKLKAKEKKMGMTVGPTFIVKDVITKRIPVRFILNEGESYRRATKDFLKYFAASLEDDPQTGLKKFTITFKKKIGEVNGKGANAHL